MTKAASQALESHFHFQATEDGNFSVNIATGDESYTSAYNPKTNQPPFQLKSPNSPCLKKPQQVQLNVKAMAIFYHKGLSHHRYLPEGQSVNQIFY
jgi:hypothetical protein